MERAVSFKRLKDAHDLLAMLEKLVDSLRNSQEMVPPWSGISLTLSNCRTLLADSLEEVSGQPSSTFLAPQLRPGSLERVPADPQTSSYSKLSPIESDFSEEQEIPSLASRIKKAPAIGGTVREIGGGA